MYTKSQSKQNIKMTFLNFKGTSSTILAFCKYVIDNQYVRCEKFMYCRKELVTSDLYFACAMHYG